ncbi:MAG: hypothetical protein IKR25_02705, partial [Muribaculaceae bacterium]|nr:hypothetical protein [Muribaculaceae bacterium]
IVYRIRDCYFIEDHHAEQMAEGGDPEDGVGVDDVPVRQSVVDGVTYDLQGRRVADTDAPGIYIRDGRKVAVTRWLRCKMRDARCEMQVPSWLTHAIPHCDTCSLKLVAEEGLPKPRASPNRRCIKSVLHATRDNHF